MTTYSCFVRALVAILAAWAALLFSNTPAYADLVFGTPQPTSVANAVHDMVMGDFDGDGNADVACLYTFSRTIEVHFGDGQGGFRSDRVATFTPTLGGSDVG